MTTRVKLLKNGYYTAEFRYLFFFWLPCSYIYSAYNTYTKYYSTEEKTLSACKQYCKETLENKQLSLLQKQASKAYKPKVIQCNQSI